MSDIVERLKFYGSNRGPLSPGAQCMAEAAAEIERLRAEVETLRRDAERYRWLRRDVTSLADCRLMARIVETLCVEQMDAAIDAAMKDRP